MMLSGFAQRAKRGWIIIATLLFLKNTHVFSNASSVSIDSDKLRRQDIFKPQPFQDEYINKPGEYPERQISNYAYYKPLNSPEKSRNTYSEDKEWLKPKDEDKIWLQNEGYKTDSEEGEDKPVYGYKAEEHHNSKQKKMDDESPFKDNKQGYFSDWTYSKHNGWKSKEQNSPLKLQSERNFPLKLDLDTSKEKDLKYKSIDGYPVEDKHSNKNTWKAHDAPSILNEDNRGHRFERVKIPDGYLNDDIPNNERSTSYRKNYEDDKQDWNYQKDDLEKEAEKEIRNEKLKTRNKWLGDNDQYHNEPEPKQSTYGGNDDFFKDVHKFKPYSNRYPDFISKFNHGGHSYGLTYTPSQDMRQLIGKNRKTTFLQEHEKKLEEMQKKHMESFEKFMGKPFQDRKKAYSSFRNPEIDELDVKPNYDSKTRVYIVNPQTHEAEREEDHHVSVKNYEIADKKHLSSPPLKASPFREWN